MSAAFSLVLALALAGPAQLAPASADVVIARAVRAHGGLPNLVKFSCITWKATGKLHGPSGAVTPYALRSARKAGEQALTHIETEVSGQRHRLVRVVRPDRGWVKLDDRVQELEPLALAEEKERLHAAWLATLTPLTYGAIAKTLVGVADIDGRPAQGVRVISEGHREVTLWFDQETGLLRKKETRVIDLARGGQSVAQETFYGGYQAIEGVQLARMVQVYWDGQIYLDTLISEMQPHERLAEEIFWRPQPD